MEKISLAIPTFNRTNFVIESFRNVLDDDRISEIVIRDDFSNINEYDEMVNLIKKINNKKIKIFRGEKNIKAFLNKFETVKLCENDWVILLDSDNIIDKNYVDKICSESLEDDVIYCPEKATPASTLVYSKYASIYMDTNFIKKEIDDEIMIRFINTGNYFLNKKEYTNTIDNFKNIDESIVNSPLDVFYFNFMWLKNSKRFKIIKGCEYYHRLHNESFYVNSNQSLNQQICKALTSMLKNL